MNDKIYENIAKLIVRANELKRLEKLSAVNDYEDYSKDLSTGNFGNVGGFADEESHDEYSAYLNRKAMAENISDSVLGNAENLSEKIKISESIMNADKEIADLKLERENAEKERDAVYDKERDEKDDYFYELRREMEAKKAAQSAAKKSSSGSSKKSSSSTKKEESKAMGKDYVSVMPAFLNTTGSRVDRYEGTRKADMYKNRALSISSGGTKKASKSELNALVKAAEKDGASDKYIEWLHKVCGYF